MPVNIINDCDSGFFESAEVAVRPGAGTTPGQLTLTTDSPSGELVFTDLFVGDEQIISITEDNAFVGEEASNIGTLDADPGGEYIVLATPGQVSLQPGDEITTDPVEIVAVDTGTVVNLDTGAQFDAIQAAENDAESGETLLVGDGTYDESVTIDTEGLTLEGPNAGIAGDGDSDARGPEASFKLGGAITADGVTIDGFELSGESRTEISGAGTTVTNSVIDVRNTAPFRINVGADNSVITQNQFTDGDGGNFVINARQNFGQLVDGVEITDNTFEDITGTGTTAIQAAGFTNANISGNSFDTIGEDAVRLAGDVSGTEVTNNEFSNYAQRFGFSASAIVANDASGDNVDISGNQFTDAGGDDVYVAAYNRNNPGAVDLGTIVGSNTFDEDVVSGDNLIVPDAGQDEVVNINTGERFSNATAIQDAVDNASSDNTLRVGLGTYDESVTVDVEGLTLEAAEGASPTVTQASGTVIDVNADSVTVDGLTVEAGDGATAVDIGGVSDGAAVTPTNNTFDLTTGNADSVGIQTGSGSGVSETIKDNTFDGLIFDTKFQDFVDDSAERLDLVAIIGANTFKPDETTFGIDTIVATQSVENAETVSSNTEFRDQLDDSIAKAKDFNDQIGETLALDSSYVDGLDDSAVERIAFKSGGFGEFYQVNVEPVNTDNANSDGRISAAFIIGNGSVVTHTMAPTGGSGDAFVFIPAVYEGEDITLVMGNFDQSELKNGEDWADLDVDSDDFQVVHIENLGNEE